jgi:Tol biopolymer transport system component
VPANDRGDGQLLFVTAGALLAQTFDTRSLKLVGEPVVVADRVDGFSASPTGTIAYRDAGDGRPLVWMNRQGVQTGTAWAPAKFNELSLSPDGSKIAVVRSDGPQTWVHDIARESSVKLSAFPTASVKPVWSPDGQTVVFAANPEGRFDIYSGPATGGGPHQLLVKSPLMKYPLSWSNDSQWLLYTSVDPVTKEDLWVAPMSGTGAGTPEPFLTTNYRETVASFSPDGRFVAYVSDETGTSEVYVRAFPPSTGGKWLLSRGGGYQPRWRPDGNELLYISGRAQLTSVTRVGASTGWANAASRVLFPAPIYGGGATINNWYWDVAAAGERMLFNAGSTEDGASVVTVVVNWHPGVRAQADPR